MTATLPGVRLAAGIWAVDPAGSRAAFTVRNFGIHQVRGMVPVLGGSVEVDPTGRPVRVTGELDLGRIDTGAAKRDADLRAPALLDLDEHPVLTYRAEAFEPEQGGWRATGELGVRGTTCGLRVRAVLTHRDGQPYVVGTAVLDRTAIGVRAPRVLIGRDVLITVGARLIRSAVAC